MALALSDRERKIAMTMIAAVALLIVYEVVISPYLDARSTVATNRAAAVQKLNDAQRLMDRQKQLRGVWTAIQQGGLQTNASQAESQIWHFLLNSAGQAGVNVGALKSERTTEEGKFQIIGVHVTGNGSTTAISRMLWSMETASIPVRINDIQIRPRKENTDDLAIDMSVSTLCLTGGGEKAVSLASGSGQP